ncbi:MAG: DnaB-like helicase N-terminal domain-containing protein [Cyanobacteria bacterium J06592_8]
MNNNNSIGASSANFRINETVIDLSEAIIGGLLLDPNAIERIDDILAVEIFPLESQQKVIRVVKDLYRQEKPVDLMTVTVELEGRGELKQVGGQKYLANILAHTVSAVNIDQYLFMLIERIENYSPDGKMRLAKALELVAEYLVSDRTEEQLTLDLEDLREKVGMPAYKWSKFIAATVRKCRKERYLLELKRLLLIDDPLEQSLEIDEVCEVYRKRRGVVQSDMVRMEAKTYTRDWHGPKLAIEYDRVEVKPKPYLIPDFLPSAASILLSGVSGTAKTQFMLDMSESLLEGQEFLGLKPSKRCKVLLLITDQSTEQSLAYLRNKGIDLTNPNLALWLRGGDDPGFTINDLAKLRQFIEDFRPDFIGADSLRTIVCHPTGISENDIEIGSHLNKLIQEATRFGSTFLLIHHENKSTEFKGVSKSSGSGDIPARFDIHWRLDKPFEYEETRVFSTAKTRSSSRNGRLTLNLDECRFELERWEMESPEFSKALSSTVSRIDHLLTINPQGLAIWDIEAMIAQGGSQVSTRTVRRCLAQMSASQSIGRKKHPTRQRAFLYYKLQLNDDEEIFSSDTSHSLCHNHSNLAENLDIQEQLTVTPTVTSPVTPNDSTVSATAVSPQNQDECHTDEAFVESDFESKSTNCDTENLPQKKTYPENVVQNETSEDDTTQCEDAVPTEDDRSLGQPSLADETSAGSDRLQYFVPGAIQVGDRVKVLVGVIEDRLGTVEAIDPKRVLTPYHIRLDNGGTTDEPLFNLELI